jgi:hypothetical protein
MGNNIEKETTITSVNNSYITYGGIRVTRIYSDIDTRDPVILLLTHPNYIDIYNQLIIGTTLNLKCTWTPDHHAFVVNSISPPDQKSIEGYVTGILDIRNELPVSDTYEIMISDFKDRLICSNEIKELVTANKTYIFTYVKAYGDCKYKILNVESSIKSINH